MASIPVTFIFALGGNAQRIRNVKQPRREIGVEREPYLASALCRNEELSPSKQIVDGV